MSNYLIGEVYLDLYWNPDYCTQLLWLNCFLPPFMYIAKRCRQRGGR